MELQTYIHNNPEYINDFKKCGFKVNKYKELYIVKYPYGFSDFKEEWMRYCRGCIINSDTNKVICVPPIKSRDIDYEYLKKNEYKIENLIDGTMINIFYHNTVWKMSSRSEIGCNNKWKSKKSFKELFNECSPTFNYNELDTNCCYSFILLHVSNRNISIIHECKLVLVDVYNFKLMKYISLDSIQSEHFEVNKEIKLESTDNTMPLEYIMDSLISQDIDSNWKGYTFKSNGLRFNVINPTYKEDKKKVINSNNKLYIYLKSKKNKKIQSYLVLYPEDKHLFENYRNKYIHLINFIYNEYVDVYIKKNKGKNNVIKNELYKIHGYYLNNQKINYTFVSNFVDKLTVGRIMHLFNLIR